MVEHLQLGEKGEELALQYLQEKNYQILETNWHYGKDEIDIIARYQNTLIIVEVKTRSSEYFGEPEFAVTKRKQQFLIRAANAYIFKKNILLETQFDIISVLILAKNTKINHIKNAFYPL